MGNDSRNGTQHGITSATIVTTNILAIPSFYNKNNCSVNL